MNNIDPNITLGYRDVMDGLLPAAKNETVSTFGRLTQI